jgi:hypothetical protein
LQFNYGWNKGTGYFSKIWLPHILVIWKKGMGTSRKYGYLIFLLSGRKEWVLLENMVTSYSCYLEERNGYFSKIWLPHILVIGKKGMGTSRKYGYLIFLLSGRKEWLLQFNLVSLKKLMVHHTRI